MAALELRSQERDFRGVRSGFGHAPVGRLACVAGPAILVVLVGVAGCEKTTHETIDKWVGTKKGPGKLEKAVRDSSLDADLRAHAAQNIIIRLGKDEVVYEAMKAASESDRQAVLAKLAPRLWGDARIEGRMSRPSDRQAMAKDALYFLRRFADDANREIIDKYLVDWLAGGYYEGRAESGRVRGEAIIRAVGTSAAPKMIEAANTLVAGGFKLGDNLLLGLAATGSADAVGKLLELAEANLKDSSLRERVFVHLFNAYVKPQDFEPPDPKALAAHVDALAKVALDEGESLEVVDIAVNLIATAGMPVCLDPLVKMVSFPHSQRRFRWIGAKRALKCGQLEAVVRVVEEFPKTGAYRRIDLEEALWVPIAAMEPAETVAAVARKLLSSDSWVARVTGVEVLGRLGLRASAASDATLLRKLARDRTPLKGWWGDQSEIPKKKRKPSPTLGQRALEVAKELEELAKGDQN